MVSCMAILQNLQFILNNLMFNEGIAGSGLQDTNVRFRMYLVFTMGIFAFGSLMYWRSQALVAADYVELPKHKISQGKTVIYDEAQVSSKKGRK